MSETTKMIGIVGVAVLFVAIVAIAAMGNPFASTTSTTKTIYPTKTTGEVQEVILSFNSNYEYEITPNTLEVGVPVRMIVDMTTVRGCLQDVVIPEYGVRKLVREGDNVIEFTPTTTGTIGIQCSMNMGRGSFTVVE